MVPRGAAYGTETCGGRCPGGSQLNAIVKLDHVVEGGGEGLLPFNSDVA
jgi:hypothetical protein